MANCARLIRRSLDIFVINGMETRGRRKFPSVSLTNNPILILESGKSERRFNGFNILEKTFCYSIFLNCYANYI